MRVTEGTIDLHFLYPVSVYCRPPSLFTNKIAIETKCVNRRACYNTPTFGDSASSDRHLGTYGSVLDCQSTPEHSTTLTPVNIGTAANVCEHISHFSPK